jgi:peptidoglycan hydrolase-like protein with peptidoglycan-binding domain
MSHQNIIKALIQANTTISILRRGSHAKKEIMALQTILNELGFGFELNWETYGADGSYGKSTTAAVALFIQKNRLKGVTAVPSPKRSPTSF